MHQVIDWVTVSEGSDALLQRNRPVGDHRLRTWQGLLAGAAQIEARALPSGPAKHTTRRQEEAAEPVQMLVNPVTHSWLTVGTPPRNTSPTVPQEHARTQSPLQPPFGA